MDDFDTQLQTHAPAPARTERGTPMQNGRMKTVYTIVEKSPEKKYWVRIGTAWVNRDNSLNVFLDAHPANNQLHIRDADPNGYQPRREPAGGAS